MNRKMPVSRDVRVNSEDLSRHDASSAVSHSSGLVTVIGSHNKDVLFESNDVGCVQWRDLNGDVIALLVSLKPGIWGISRRGEADWDLVLNKYGLKDGQGTSVT